MTDKQWAEAIGEIESMRFQLVNNIMPFTERQDLQRNLAARLSRLADAMQPSVDAMLATIAAVHGDDDEAEMMAVEMADKAKRRGVR